MNILPALLEARARYGDDEDLTSLGDMMYTLYAERGFPPDMFLLELQKGQTLNNLQRVYIVSVYQDRFLEHRRKSGVQEKNLESIRRKNREQIGLILKGKETGIY